VEVVTGEGCSFGGARKKPSRERGVLGGNSKRQQKSSKPDNLQGRGKKISEPSDSRRGVPSRKGGGGGWGGGGGGGGAKSPHNASQARGNLSQRVRRPLKFRPPRSDGRIFKHFGGDPRSSAGRQVSETSDKNWGGKKGGKDELTLRRDEKLTEESPIGFVRGERKGHQSISIVTS